VDVCTEEYCDPVLGWVSNPVTCQPKSRCWCATSESDDGQAPGCQCRAQNWFEQLPTSAKIGAGAVTGIVIAGIAAMIIFGVSGKKVYDHYRLMNSKDALVEDNPLYKAKGTETDNPFYASKTDLDPEL